MISGNVPKHLVAGARTGFLTSLREKEYPWQQVAMQVGIGEAAVDLVDLGAAPMPTNSKSGITVQDFIEKTIEVKPVDWDITVYITQNAIDDDQTASLERKVKSAGDNFQKHINARVFTVLNGGDGTTYGLCYDGQEFFDLDHVDAGGQYQTNQDNEYALVLSPDAFETVWVAAQGTLDDQGQYTQYTYDLLVVPPALFREARQITANREDAGTANRAINPWMGLMKAPLVSPYLDSTAWHLVASSEPIKPLLVVMRKQPHLQAAWFDPRQPDGGRHYFKFFARYEVYYGDWRLAYQGNT